MTWPTETGTVSSARRSWCAQLECSCDLDLNQWAAHINFPSTSSPGMFVAELAPMETDSAMAKRKRGRFRRSTSSRIVLQFVERCAEELLAQRLNTGLVPK